MLKLPPSEIRRLAVVKQSVDARIKKRGIRLIYTVNVEAAKEEKALHKANNPHAVIVEKRDCLGGYGWNKGSKSHSGALCSGVRLGGRDNGRR